MILRLPYYYEMFRKVHSLQSVPKFWNYIKYRCLPRKAKTSVKRYTPQIASILVTSRCNLNCGYCVSGKVLHKDKDKWRNNEATLEKIKKIFSNPLFANVIGVDLQGGEPLLVKDLERIVSWLSKHGHLVNISTNGLLLLDRITGLKRAGIPRINVSIYDVNRKVIERDIVKINKIFPVHTSIVLLKSQVEKEPEKVLKAACFLRDAGCLSLRFWIYRPVGIDPKPEEIINDTFPAYVEFRKRMEKALPGFCLWPSELQTGKVKKLCPQLWQRISCDATGKMMICCGTDATLKGPNSNLFECDPDTLSNHPTLVSMRKKLLDPECDPPDICKTCNLLGEPGW